MKKVILRYTNNNPIDEVEIQIPLETLSNLKNLQYYFDEFLQVVRVKETRNTSEEVVAGPDGNCEGF